MLIHQITQLQHCLCIVVYDKITVLAYEMGLMLIKTSDLVLKND